MRQAADCGKVPGAGEVVPVRMNRERVLMFTVAFPPRGGAAVIRTVKQVKYLSQEGFDAVVVAGPARGGEVPNDPELSRDVPAGTVVLRARELPLHHAAWNIDGLLRRVGLPAPALAAALWPDHDIGWLPAAVVLGLRAVRRSKPRLLYSTAGPMTAHLAALIVQRLTGLAWVADFHDGWALHPTYPFHRVAFRYPAVARAGTALERRVVSEATRITVACDSIRLAALPAHEAGRSVIRNGVDVDDLELAATRQRPPERDHLQLAHVGSLREWRDPAPVLTALRGLAADGTLDLSRFELRVVGYVRLVGARFEPLPVTFTGHITHYRALAEMMSASALLLYQPSGVPSITSKVYEYLASGRPVVCVADPDNRAYRLVRELRGGWCADVRDSAQVQHVLGRLVEAWRRDELTPDPSAREQVLCRFSQRRLGAQLAAVFRRAIAGDRESPPASEVSALAESCR